MKKSMFFIDTDMMIDYSDLQLKMNAKREREELNNFSKKDMKENKKKSLKRYKKLKL